MFRKLFGRGGNKSAEKSKPAPVHWSRSGGIRRGENNHWTLNFNAAEPAVILGEIADRIRSLEKSARQSDRDELQTLKTLRDSVSEHLATQGEPVKDTTIRALEPESDDGHFGNHSSTYTQNRQEWVDPSNSKWRDYEGFFFHDKGWYRDTPQWRQVLRVCHAHWNLDRAIRETYYRREIDGVEPTIPLCREQMAIAPQVKVALEMHEKFEYDYRSKELERLTREYNKLGWGDYPGWEPILRPFKLPEHTGFKQLAIIYDKMKDFESAIAVCREAEAIDWPGDWDVRIARYTRRLESQRKKKGTPKDIIN